MTKMLGHVTDSPDVLAVVLIEPLRPLLAPVVRLAPIPPPLAGLKDVPDLVNYVAVKANLTGDMSMTLSIRANDDAAAKQLEEIIDGLMAQGKQAMLAEVAKQEASSDPVEQAMAKYAKRASERMLEMLRPVRNGATLSLSGSGTRQRPDRHHRHPPRSAAAGRAIGKGGRPAGAVGQQPEADRPGAVEL